MNKELSRNILIAITLIVGILGIFMGPGLIRPTAGDVIEEFAHLYFEATPEDYDLLFPNNKYSKNEARKYIEKKLEMLVTSDGVDKIIESDTMVSHIKRAYIKKVNMSMDKIKICITRHEDWKDIYKIHGIINSEKIEDASTEKLEFNGDIIIIEENGRFKIDRIFMIYDEAAYFNNSWK